MTAIETVVIFEIDQPFCTRTYGVAPCASVLGTTGANKCHNGRFTCQDVPHYDPGVLTLSFSYQNVDLIQYGYVIPSLVSVGTTAPSINLAGMDVSAAALGQRESVSVKLFDLKHSDLNVDKYRLERITGAASSPSVPFDPYNQGTLWRKWLARNPYYASYPAYRARIRRGYVGQALSEMSVRNYSIDRIDFGTDGSVTFILKDIFSKLDDKKSVAPKASLGELSAGITNVATAATLAPAGIGNLNYPASGWIRIGDEIMSFTRAADALTLVRGQLNTTADAHNTQDAVQIVLAYSAQRPHNIAYDLLTNYTPFLTTDINKTDWDVSADAAAMNNLYTSYITEPTPVSKLLGELSEQARFTLYPDPSVNLIRFIPLVAGATNITVDDDAWIVSGSLSLKKQDTKRLSQVWVYYGQKNPTRKVDDVNNYFSRYITQDANAESATQYGTASIREIFSRWIPALGRASATETAEGLLFMFRDPPMEAKFSIHKSKISSFAPARLIGLKTDMVTDVLGAKATMTHAVTSMETQENRTVIKSQQVFFSTPSNVRKIYIDFDLTSGINFRTEHDKLFSAPTGTETVQIIQANNVRIGSNSIAVYAARTGLWPAGTTLQWTIGTGAEVWAMGGRGGKGGNVRGVSGSLSADPGENGQNGGPCFLAERAISITNNGTINGGAPGAGGGGAMLNDDPFGSGLSEECAGSGGGGGRSFVTSAGGAPGISEQTFFQGGPPYWNDGQDGQVGTWTGPGLGGGNNQAPIPPSSGDVFGGQGATGGQPGGSAGTGQAGTYNPTNVTVPTSTAGGSPGTAGHAVDGNGFITWVATGTRNGVIA